MSESMTQDFGCTVMSYGYLNSGKLKQDLFFLVSSYRDDNIIEAQRNIFLRSAIVFMAFYVECLSNTLFDNKNRVWKNLTGKGSGHLPKPIRRFIAYYELTREESFTLDYNGVQDLFTVRNKTLAHSPEKTILFSNNPNDETVLQYQKLELLPFSIFDFNTSHADMILNEMSIFLDVYTEVMGDSLPNWWMENVRS